jgi:hypothetical protein
MVSSVVTPSCGVSSHRIGGLYGEISDEFQNFNIMILYFCEDV